VNRQTVTITYPPWWR